MFRNIAFILILCGLAACNRLPEEHEKIVAPFLQEESVWVDTLLKKMTVEEKIGQLLFLQTRPADSIALNQLYRLAARQQLGGVLVDKLNLSIYADLIDSLNALSAIPLFFGTSEQVALNNQIGNAIELPDPEVISAIASDSIRQMVDELYIRQCRALGINLSFSPSLQKVQLEDSSYNKQAFESDPETIVHRSSKRLDRLKESQILSIAQSFADFIRLPNDTTNFVDSILHPYYNLVQNGLSGILVADQLYQIDTFNRLQADFLKTYLNKHLEFDGLLISRQTKTATLDKMIHAGTDLFVIDSNVEAATAHLKAYVEEGLMPMRDLNEKVRKVLLAKSWMGLDSLPSAVNYAESSRLLLDQRMGYFVDQLEASALTLVSNPDSMLPFKNIHRRHFKIIRPEGASLATFRDVFFRYADYRNSRTTESEEGKWFPVISKNLVRSTVVVALDKIDLNLRQHGDWINSINELSTKTSVVILNFGSLLNLQHFDSGIAMIQAWESNRNIESLAAQLLFGGAIAEGQLPMALSEELPFRHQASLGPLRRLSYAEPQAVGISPVKMVGIDAIFQSAIELGATPGGQVLVIKEGKVIYDKAFGYQSHRKKKKVAPTDLYDLASITKIAATTMSAMKLYGDKQFKMSDRYGKYVDCEKGSKVAKISLKKLFTHASSLQSNMPIAPYITLKDTMAADSNLYFCKTAKGEYRICIADSVYMDQRWVDTIWQQVLSLKPQRRRTYRYSDVNFNLIQRFLETVTKEALDEYAKSNFYEPLNLRHTTYRPLEEFKPDQICPTAEDLRWRKQELRGYVHDEAAALFNGVGGNAGLFSNARDLAVLFQMLLNGGSYGDQQLLDKKTIDYFTSNRHGNHRGLGFDKPAKRRRTVPSYSNKASSKSYGHTGFTGPCIWVDPTEDLIYIFIANRVNPNPQNRKLFKHKIRSRIHNVVYDAFESYEAFSLDGLEQEEVKEMRAEVRR